MIFMPPSDADFDFGAGVFGLDAGDAETGTEAQVIDAGKPVDTSGEGENFEWLTTLGSDPSTVHSDTKEAPVESGTVQAISAGDIPAAPTPPGVMTFDVTDADMARAAQLGVPVSEFLNWGNSAPQKLATAERYISYQKMYAQPQQQQAAPPPPPPVFNEAEVLAKYAKDYEPDMAKELVDAQRAKFEAEQARREIAELRGYMQQQAQQTQQMQAAQAYQTWTNVIQDAAMANPVIATVAQDPAAMQAIQNETMRIMTSLTQAGQPMLTPAEFAKRAAFALYGDQILAGAGKAIPSPVMTKQEFQAGATARPRPSGQQRITGGREAAVEAVSQLPAMQRLRSLTRN